MTKEINLKNLLKFISLCLAIGLIGFILLFLIFLAIVDTKMFVMFISSLLASAIIGIWTAAAVKYLRKG